MPRFPGFLDRFRRLLAPPGRPSEAVGVPASGDDLETELLPLLERLATIGAEADRIVAQACDEADRRRERARAEAAAILDEAREEAEAERVRAATKAQEDARDDDRPAVPRSPPSIRCRTGTRAWTPWLRRSSSACVAAAPDTRLGGRRRPPAICSNAAWDDRRRASWPRRHPSRTPWRRSRGRARGGHARALGRGGWGGSSAVR